MSLIRADLKLKNAIFEVFASEVLHTHTHTHTHIYMYKYIYIHTSHTPTKSFYK